MESVIAEHEVMVITKAGNPARREIEMWRGLGELGAREMALATPDPGTKALRSPHEPEGALAIMMPEHDPLLSSSHAERLVTAVA